MAKKVNLLKAEEAALRTTCEALSSLGGYVREVATLRELIAKLDAPVVPKTTGLFLPHVEQALRHGKKYAPWWGSPAPQLRRLNEAGATLEQLEVVARWTNRQGWLTNFTLQSVANNFGSWLAQAMVKPSAGKPVMGGLVGFESDETI